jgi:hypothetical protein
MLACSIASITSIALTHSRFPSEFEQRDVVDVLGGVNRDNIHTIMSLQAKYPFSYYIQLRHRRRRQNRHHRPIRCHRRHHCHH